MAATLTYLQTASSASDSSSYTFSSQNFGVADANRYIVAVIGSRKSGASANVTSATIGGVSATIVANNPAFVTNTGYAGIAIAAVPTGTSGNVVINFSGTMVRCTVGLYSVVGINPTVYSTLEVDGSTLSGSISTVGGGITIGVATNSVNNAFTWTNLTEDYDNNETGESTYRHTSASLVEASTTTKTVTASATGLSGEASLAVAHWQPTSVTTTTQTITGLSRITSTVPRTQAGKAAIRSTTTRTQTGVANISLASIYYFDGHTSITDPDGVWISDASAADGSTSTFASTLTQAGAGTIADELAIAGTNAPSTGVGITSVRVRIYSSALGGSTGWSAWFTLSAPAGGWDWATIQSLSSNVFIENDGSGGFDLRNLVYSGAELLTSVTDSYNAGGGSPPPDGFRIAVYRVEIEVTTSTDTTTTKTQTGVARITATTTRTQTGKAAIRVTVARTQNGISRVTAISPRTQLGKAAVLAAVTRTQTGKSSVLRTTTRTQSGVSAIAQGAQRAQTGVARITAATIKTQTGVSRITATTTRAQTGVASITTTTTTVRTQVGRSAIKRTTSRAQFGVASIVTTTTRTQTGKSRITVAATKNQTGKAAIIGVTHRTITGQSRIIDRFSREKPAIKATFSTKPSFFVVPADRPTIGQPRNAKENN